ncbi:hypothetical protein [Paenibacillus sp. JJ-223]|uniref:hypothetical protein n=1 Tax=Paenibacillus sp. JJ-223 TaxID=2905647 RepID=UPI001F38785B|nr:hypothetical protein [Paenibacillus sp. JJ-223]CAH1220710.1 hypothetical protein PAECIP111890_05116 [Paenibacillus sp. JJ-223]
MELQHLNRTAWAALSSVEKEQYLQELTELPEGVAYEGLRKFERYGRCTETGVFSYEQRDFVFVPGDLVTLGWDGWHEGMNEETAIDIRETFSEYGVHDIDAYLREFSSPVREVHISPMLVECQARSLGWFEVSEEEAMAWDDGEFAKEWEKFKQSDISEYERYQHFRLVRHEGGIRIFWFNEDLTLERLKEETEKTGFSLLTEEEWEYLYGGGCRTLFPWGDSFDYTMKLKHFGSLQGVPGIVDENAEPDPSMVEDDGRAYDLELPNFFGIRFEGDPYRCELTLSQTGELMPKGGDGGSLICGGLGPVAGFLPATVVYYRDANIGELEWEELIDGMYYRRVIQISSSCAPSQK